MFDGCDFANGNVRIPHHLRRRRIGHGDRNYDARLGHVGPHCDVGYIDVVDDLGDVRDIDFLRNAGNIRIDGDVRLGLKQRCRIVDADFNLADPDEQRRANRRSIGVLRNWQSWSQFRSGGTDDKRIAANGQRDFGASGADDAHRFIHDNKHHPVKHFFICEREWP